MVVFPEETKFYTKWQHALEARGVKVRLSTEVDVVVERGSKGVKVLTRPRRPQEDNHNPNGADQDLPQTLEEYDEVVLCVLADTAQRLLGKTSRWIDRQVLGSTKWADDITVTHNVCFLANVEKRWKTDVLHCSGYRVHEEMVYMRL